MVKRIELSGYIPVNCYIFSDDETKHCYIIDPGAQVNVISAFIKSDGLIPDCILLTHGHFDHSGEVNAIRKKFDIPVYCYSNEYLEDPDLNLSCEFYPFTVENTLRYPDVITLKDGHLPLKVLHTPGHTDDSVILYSEEKGIAFSGDTIFKQGMGSYILPGGDYYKLASSLKNIVFSLPDNTVLYPGHGDVTKIGGQFPHS